MGSKINLNINNEWEGEVRPILEEWKEYGDFSGKVCESIVFMKQATMEKIYQAIMAYDKQWEDTIESQYDRPPAQWEKIAIGMIEKGNNPLNFLTKAMGGPLLTESAAKREIIRLKRLKIEGTQLKRSDFDVFESQYPLHKVIYGTGNFVKETPEALAGIIKNLESNLRIARQVLDAHQELVKRSQRASASTAEAQA
jgi:hypothetical protein